MVAEVDPTDMEIVAWIGPDEFDGSRGIKGGHVTAGFVPLAAKGEDEHKLRREELRIGLQILATRYRTRIQLVRFKYAEVIETLVPDD